MRVFCGCCFEQRWQLILIIVLATQTFLLHVCFYALVVFFFYTYWERPSRLHWCPCVIELKWAWFMLGPTEFPSWRLLLQTFQLVYTTRLERTVAKSLLCPQTIPQRSFGSVQTDFVAENGVTWSTPPIGAGSQQCRSPSSCWLIASSISPFHPSSCAFWMIGETSSNNRRKKSSSSSSSASRYLKWRQTHICSRSKLPFLKPDAQCLWAVPQRST